MGQAIRATYGVVDPTASHGGPFSYATYLMKLLKRQFWGDDLNDVGPQDQCCELKDPSGISNMAQLCPASHRCGPPIQFPHPLFCSRLVKQLVTCHTSFLFLCGHLSWVIIVPKIHVRPSAVSQAIWSLAHSFNAIIGHLHNHLLVACLFSLTEEFS